jgi:hypothetical protein
VPRRRSSSNVRRERTDLTPVIVRPTGAVPVLTPTTDGVPSPGATGSPHVRPWSTSACGIRGSWPVSVRLADRYASFRPLPSSPWTVEQFGVACGRGPDHRDQGIPLHARRNPASALVDHREAHRLGTVYRSEHSKWLLGTQHPTRPVACPDERSRVSKRRSSARDAALPALRTQGGARPQLWIVLWTESTVQGRRPT